MNIYVIQQDTQSFLMVEFYSSHMLARHVSDLNGPSSGAFYKLYLQICYVVLLCVLLDTASRYLVTAGRVEQYAYYHIPKSAHTACTKRS